MSEPSADRRISSAQITASGPLLRESTWNKIFLFLVGSLSSTIMLKIAQIQYLEIIYAIQLLWLLVGFVEGNFLLTMFLPYWRLSKHYLFFFSCAIVLSICALRYDFYLPDELSLLKYPIAITISRMFELSASVIVALYLASRIRSHLLTGRFIMRVYFWTGFASALYSILSYPLSRAGIVDLGTYSDSYRMRGFYNEGGPYGLYVISLFLVGFALYRLRWEKRNRLFFAAFPLVVAFLGSQSKAAFLAVLIMFLINGLLVRSFVQKTILASTICLFLVGVTQIVDLGKALRLYQVESQAYERVSHRRSHDANFVYGRVAGAFIVPRMIAAHPIMGVGWGNYGLVRNAPEYRGASSFVRDADEPGLGLLGTAADLGLPLTLYLVCILSLPFIYLRRLRMPIYLTNLALLQPLVHVFGAQLNLTYPWVVTAIALGLAYGLSKSDLADAPQPTPARKAAGTLSL